MGNGDVSLTATVNSCSNFTVQKDIVVGAPQATNIIIWSSSNSTTTGMPIEFTAGYPPNDRCDIQSADWDVLNMNASIYNGSFPCISNNGTNKLIAFHSTGTANVRVRIQNTCGWSPWSVGKPIQVNSGYFYTISPNPAQSTITIASKEQYTMTENSKFKALFSPTTHVVKQVKIYSASGKQIKQLQFSGSSGRIQIDISDLTAGLYLVKISDGKHNETHKLVVTK